MRYLLYGGLGFIGANVVEALAGEEVYVAHRPGSPRRKPALAGFVSRHAELIEYTDPAKPLESAKPDVVINLVGEYYGSPAAVWEANAEFPKRLCDAARRAGWRGKMVHISAATVRGPVGNPIREEERHLEGIKPISHFDASKAEGERVVANCFEDWVIVRPVLVYGRFNDHPEWVTLTGMVRRGVAPMVNLAVSAISARELAKVVKLSTALSREYFFATECAPRRLSDFVLAIEKALGRRALHIPVPSVVMRIAAPRDLKKHLPFLGRSFSCEKMARLLKYRPSPDFEREVAEMVYNITATVK
jgi:nucleoside-diphosphate-sugar epimerase